MRAKQNDTEHGHQQTFAGVQFDLLFVIGCICFTMLSLLAARSSITAHSMAQQAQTRTDLCALILPRDVLRQYLALSIGGLTPAQRVTCLLSDSKPANYSHSLLL